MPSTAASPEPVSTYSLMLMIKSCLPLTITGLLKHLQIPPIAKLLAFVAALHACHSFLSNSGEQDYSEGS